MRFAPLTVAVALATLPAVAGAQRAALPRDPIALVNANVVDVRTGQIARGVTIVLRDGRIASVGSGAGEGTTRIDARGRYVIPGLFDAHTHIGNLRAARAALESGVTTARSAGVSAYVDVGLRELARSGAIAGPDFLAAGYHVRPQLAEDAFLTDPGLWPFMNGGVTTADAIRQVVRANLARGVDWIKTTSTERAGLPETDPRKQLYTEADVKVMVDEAASKRIPVMAHAHGEEGALAAVKAGVRSIEHGTYLSDEALALMAKQGTFLVPTYATVIDLVEPGGDYDDAGLHLRGAHMLPRLRETVERAHKAGVKIVTGADTGYGPSSVTRIAHEVAAFVDIGMTPLQALQSATTVAAELFGMQGRVGAIEPGLEADLVVVERNPLDNVRTLQDPLLVISNGRVALNRLTFGKAEATETSAASSQHGDHAGGASGEKLGQVQFETSCAPAVRGDFNRAVALLHSFEFQSAHEGFNRVATRDPACAIAYWGMALCHWGNPFGGIKTGAALERGQAAVQKGLATGSPTPRERAYIEAAAELYENAPTASHRDRTLAYEKAMERVQREFPADAEARMFYALAVSQTALSTDKTYANQLKAGAILEPLFRQFPEHPGLAHYIIHAYDVPALAPKALDAARRYSKVAPSAPHALHMPSHTFTRVGYWKESIDTNIASERVALEQNVVGEALHAMDYQIYAYLQTAQDRKALEVVQRYPAVAARLDMNAMGGAASPVNATYAVSAIPARYALERGEWAEAAALVAVPSPAPHVNAITPFARALGAARSGKAAAARADVARLEALRDELAARKDAYWSEQVDIQRRVALAWIAFAEGRREEGIQMLRAAAEAEDATDKAAVTPGPLAPARELLGEMLLESGNAAEALKAFEASIAKEPGRFRGAYGAARAAEAAGDHPRARRYYGALLDIAQGGDAGRPAIEHARAYLARR